MSPSSSITRVSNKLAGSQAWKGDIVSFLVWIISFPLLKLILSSQVKLRNILKKIIRGMGVGEIIPFPVLQINFALLDKSEKHFETEAFLIRGQQLEKLIPFPTSKSNLRSLRKMRNICKMSFSSKVLQVATKVQMNLISSKQFIILLKMAQHGSKWVRMG